MRSVSAAVGIIGGAAALVLGCGGGSGSGGSVPFDQLATEYASVFCHKAFTCCDAAELAGSNPTATDEAGCRAIVETQVSDNLVNDQTSIAAGRLVYHGDSARRCFDSLAALACSQWGANEELIRLPDCLHVTEGAVAPGGTCARDPECAGGFCDNGTCVAFADVGESCAGTSCATGLHCSADAAGLPTVCTNPLPDGSACMYDDDCASASCNIDTATNTASCGPPTFCNGV
jgi:hypothetical protein